MSFATFWLSSKSTEVELEVDRAHDRLEVLDALAEQAILLVQELRLLGVASALAGLELELALALLVARAHRVERYPESAENRHEAD